MLVVENCYLPYKFSESWVIWVDLNPLLSNPTIMPPLSRQILYDLTILVKNIFLIEILVELTEQI